MDAAAVRAHYPVLTSVAYLNAGTCGPLPTAALRATDEAGRAAVERGRGKAYFEEMLEVRAALRAAYAGVVGGRPEEVALTTATSDGMASVLAGLGLRRGDEVLTADDEHPGLYGPLAAARAQLGIEVHAVPLAELPDAVGPRTRLVACSHVSWVSGRVVNVGALASSHALVLLDGAQGLGAIPCAVDDLGCDFYAASGQKWLCGADASGFLFVRSELLETVAPSRPGYDSLADPDRASELPYHPDARRFDAGALGGPEAALSLASLDVLEEAGWDWVLRRGPELAARLTERLAERGLEVLERGPSTLVSWHARDPAAAVERLTAAGVVVRSIPPGATGREPLLRASVGAWSSDEDIERLVALAAG